MSSRLSSSRCAMLLVAAVLPLGGVAAQSTSAPASVPAAFAWTDDEWLGYVRALQGVGVVATVDSAPWTIRGFGLRSVRGLRPRTANHPWTALVRMPGTNALWVAWLNPEARLIANTAYPFGQNDGAVWAGRGLTSVVQAGAIARLGPLTVTVQPQFFRAENSAFELHDNGMEGRFRYGDAVWATSIDLPQRYGDRPYQRFDHGNSSVELDGRWVTLGFSWMAEQWGPGRDHPIVLGNNAGGFPHLFLGTAQPLNVIVGRVHTRMLWGRLDQSRFTVMDTVERRRFASGIIGSFMPRGIPGLEIGAIRFFHQLWPDSGLTAADFTRPLSGLLKESRVGPSGNPLGNEPDNQLASVFFRWVFPASGFEVYGEYGRDDHNVNLRDLAKQPDHISAYLLGAQRSWLRNDRMLVLRAEVLNARISPLQLVRSQAPFYVHSVVRQGHTVRGQSLGSPAAFGGGAAVLGFDRYDATGRWSLDWSRQIRRESPSSAGVPDPFGADVFHSLSFHGVRALPGRRVAVLHEITGVYEMNRDFKRDAVNLRASLGARFAW